MLAAYLLAQCLALFALLMLAVPVWLSLIGIGVCLAHALWALPRHLLLTSPHAVSGLRRDASTWYLWTRANGWQAVQLLPDSMALPGWVLLRYKRPGERRVRSACILADALEPVQHRRLRLRLKFSRRRWAAPE
nr:protein YgfX [Pseudomonas sp. R5(2019)]